MTILINLYNKPIWILKINFITSYLNIRIISCKTSPAKVLSSELEKENLQTQQQHFILSYGIFWYREKLAILALLISIAQIHDPLK